MPHILAIAVGGATGSVLRYLVGRALADSVVSFPWGTLLINVLGCGLLGLFIGLADSRLPVSPEVRSLVSVGLLGGFTTFSTFAHQTAALWQSGRVFAAAGNVAISVLCGLIAAWGGWRLALAL
jgi:CrcB protein